MASYIGNRSALVNATRGLSSFVMVDLAAEDVALMQSVTTINIGGEDNPHKVNSINNYKLRGIYDDNKEIFKPTL